MSAIEFHRLAHLRPRYRWWRMLLTGLLAVTFYVVILVIVMAPVLAPEPGRCCVEIRTKATG